MSSKEIVIGTQVSRLIKDEALPNAVKSGVQKAILQETDIAPNIVDQTLGSVGVKAERMYEHAAKGGYVHGLPSGQFTSASQGTELVEQILSAIEGRPVLADYCRLGPPNAIHMGWMYIISHYGYSTVTNKLPSLVSLFNTPTYLVDMRPRVPAALFETYKPGVLDIWGMPPNAGPTPFRVDARSAFGSTRAVSSPASDSTAAEEFLDLTYTWEGAGGDFPESAVIHVPWTALADQSQQYFQAKYTVNGVVKYWAYRVGSGAYPQLDAVASQPPAQAGSFFPFLYFRFGKHSEVDDTTTATYKSSKKLASYLGIDYDAMGNAVNANPDIDDVEQAMLIMAVPAVTTNPMERRYLFTFFDNVFRSQGVDNQVNSYELGSVLKRFEVAGGNPSDIVIQDARFKMALANSGIYKQRVIGSIGPVGSYDSGVGSRTTAGVRYDVETGVEVPMTVTTTFHYYRRQISPVVYEHIEVIGLGMLYYVAGSQYTAGGENNEKILLIPIDRSITQDYTIREREILYARSLHMVFNSLQIVKIKWYQTFFFEFVMVVIAAVVIAVSFGTADGPVATLISAIASGSTAAITSAVMVLLEQYLIGLLIQEAFKLVVKAIGGELAIALAIAMTVYAAYTGVSTGSLDGAPFARDMLDAASGLVKAVSANYADKMKDLLDEGREFADLAKQQSEELTEANKLLEHSNHLAPFVIFGESPNDFYNRTVHSGNIGIQTIGAISSFVDTALRLPTLAESTGGNFNGAT